MKYVALLRGINVGGNSLIKMVELKSCFEKLGLKDVLTYIQSGNVIFDAPSSGAKTLADKIEKAITKTFKVSSRVLLVSVKGLRHVVDKTPKGFGKNPAAYRYDVIFLYPSLDSKIAVKAISVNPEVDKVYAGLGVVYYSRLISKITKSRISKIVGTPIYKSMTIRNWNTTTKLLNLMKD
jgi:uncharacterized protein (DUF1697 family)